MPNTSLLDPSSGFFKNAVVINPAEAILALKKEKLASLKLSLLLKINS